MLTIRGKTILIVIAIVLVITVSTLGAGLFISQYRFMETVKSDLLTMSRIASGLVSAEIDRLRQEAEFAASLVGMGHQDVPHTLDSLLKEFPSFIAFSVMDQGSNTVQFAGDGDARPMARSRESEYGKRAFAGETVITTTMFTPAENLVMHIWTPVNENRVLVATLPGMYLSSFVSRFRVWGTGNIFILDNEGISIAAVWEFRVRERHNYIEWGKRDPNYRKIGEVFHAMVQYDEGFAQYPLDGVERYCAYGPIPGTDDWSVGVAAPLSESPLSHIRQMLIIFAAVFLGLGIIAALIAANSIAIPYEKMEELSRSAAAASDSKTRFLANMSHEMRTPLNAIIGLSELELGTANLEGDTFTNIEKIYSAGMTLLGIINDLLDISKIESGKFTMIPVVYDVPSMVNDTVSLNMVRIGSKPVQFRLHLNGSLPCRLKGDELRVKQVFNNLLSNAFKYTDTGTVDWTISCKHEGNRIKVISTVQDTGKGIRAEDQEKLFRDYYQANLHANYYVEGTGLGLSITNNLVKHMGGSIKVKSEFGRGSIFTVEFFQESAGDQVIGDEAAENLSQFRYSVQRRNRNQKLPRADMSYATVLVVDDVVTNLDVARGMLKPYGINVDCVSSGEEAIRRIREAKVRYNAIFMDHMMPGLDGIEATRIIRKEIGTEYAKTVPIIALTANALLGNDSLFLENGFQAFLSKPIDILRLDNILHHWVRDKKQERPPLPQAPEPENSEGSGTIFKNAVIPGLDTKAGLGRLDDDEESYLRILQSFTIHTPAFLDTARAADSAAIEAYRIAVHSVKGSSRSIGAEALGKEAEKLESAATGGDWAYIEAHNRHFIITAEQLLAGIRAFLQTVPDKPDPQKPEKESPDPEIIAALRQAVETYNMAALHKAIDSLDAFRYRAQPDLAGWLREQAGRSDFAAIQKRLDSL
jgi:signal transduction histidine kinase/CheY-like chemotaxis protein